MARMMRRRLASDEPEPSSARNCSSRRLRTRRWRLPWGAPWGSGRTLRRQHASLGSAAGAFACRLGWIVALAPAKSGPLPLMPRARPLHTYTAPRRSKEESNREGRARRLESGSKGAEGWKVRAWLAS